MAGDGRKAPRPVCANHLDRDSCDQCAFCGRPICAECTHRSDEDPVCQHCLDRIGSPTANLSRPEPEHSRHALIWGFGLPAVAGVLYLIWRFLVP